MNHSLVELYFYEQSVKASTVSASKTSDLIVNAVFF